MMMESEGQGDFVLNLEFQLDADLEQHASLVEQYIKHYRRYPTFAPVDNM
jgi:hypothetical protein